MSLTIITTPRKKRDFLVYDLEWVPGTLELRLAGVYDGNRFRCYTSIDAFLNKELTARNRGKWFYAHAGGLADFQFVLEKLQERPDYSVKASFSGSSAIIVHVRRGKNVWHFVDSYWLLRDKLDNIGKWIGLHKGEAEKRQTKEEAKEFYRSAPLDILMAYNERDCVILWQAIAMMQDVLWELGGQLQMTLASSAMNLFRRRFLKADIDTSEGINEQAEQAYFASRVEVISTQCHDAEYYDINSSFPFSMTRPCPGNLINTTRHLPDYGLYIADVTVTVPECFLPPLPFRIKGRLFFPTGTWRTWLSNVDIELLQEEGCRIERVWECLHFEPFTDLAEYALTIYDLRKQAKTPFEKTAFKLLLNSLYGKFAERRLKTGLRLNPENVQRDKWEMLFPGAWLVESLIPVPHRHVPISVHITSLSRRWLYEHMSTCREVHYCDTDGFSTTEHKVTGLELGNLKLEKRIREGYFAAPKVYRLQGEYLDRDEWKPLDGKGVKAKGMSLAKGQEIAQFEALLEGKAIEAERMKRIKELAREGHFKPREEKIHKRLKKETLSKRSFYPDGQSRPWQVKELAQYFQGNRQW